MAPLLHDPAAAEKPAGADRAGTIEVHVREAGQLFDSLDPCPFYQRDLDSDAEEYILASLRELRQPPHAIVVYLDSVDEMDERTLEQAIHKHFVRKAQFASEDLRKMLRRGWISFAIGLAFLGTLVITSELVASRMTPGPLATVLRESLVIGGWVAMWRPLEIFLYDWWPIVGQRRAYRTLGRLPVTSVKS
jgi:hypothetical protein